MPAANRELPPRTRAEVLEAFPHLRQSLLATFDSCALATRWQLEGLPTTNAAQARGILFHRTAQRILETLRRTGEVRIPVEEALAIMYEVCAQRDVPPEDVVVVPAAERRVLRMAVVSLAAKNSFSMDRLIDVERRLFSFVEYPDEHGQVVQRRVTGQPDALVADPPDGAVVLDWKTALGAPSEYTGDQRDVPEGVSVQGYFQQRVYALLVMDNYPSVQRVTLREFYPIPNEARTATVWRQDLETVRADLAAQVEVLDRLLMEGTASPAWRPSPGKHCGYCPRPGRCPIPDEERREGAVTSAAQAARYAEQMMQAEAVRSHRIAALKTWVAEHGAVPVRSGKARLEVRWKTDAGGRRRFGVHPPLPPDPEARRDPELDAALAEAAERRAAA